MFGVDIDICIELFRFHKVLFPAETPVIVGIGP
jgi:hypothetical protein